MSAGIQVVVAALLRGGVEGSTADDCKELGNTMLKGIVFTTKYFSQECLPDEESLKNLQPENLMTRYGCTLLALPSDPDVMYYLAIEAPPMRSLETSKRPSKMQMSA